MVELILLACRASLAAVFLLAGSTKLIDPAEWRKALRDFSLPSLLIRPVMLLLPVLELSVAVALIPASLAWFGARGSLVLLIAFMVAVGIAMIRGRKPDCHCFGQLHSAPVGRSTLVRNGVLALIAAFLSSRAPGRLGPDLWAWYPSLGVEGRKFAAVAGCVAAFLFIRLLLRARPQTESSASQTAPPDVEGDDVDTDVAEEKASARPVASKPRPSPEPAAQNALGIGLPVGTPAPEFTLPGMNGEMHSSHSLRKQGRDLMLVFTSPWCKPCESVPSSLVKWAREMERFPNIILISRGTAEENRPKLQEFGTSQVLLQRSFEVAEMFDCISTPSAVLVGSDGLIRSPLATGGPAIKKLLLSTTQNTVGSRD